MSEPDARPDEQQPGRVPPPAPPTVPTAYGHGPQAPPPHGGPQQTPYPPGVAAGPPHGYGPGYAPAYGPPARRNNTMAITAFALSLSGLIVGITAPVGAILGHVALGQVKRTGEAGHGFALAAVIIGWTLTALAVLAIVAWLLFAGFFMVAWVSA